MGDITGIQLSLVHEVNRLLRDAHVPHWLFGGWAVDFHTGSVTREHGDLEFFIWQRDGPRAGDLLDFAGYHRVDHAHPDEASIWRKRGQIVELYFRAVTVQGDVVGCGRWCNWPHPANAMGSEIRMLEGVQCPVVSVECILSTKLEYERQTGIPPRDKDQADVLMLAHVLGDGWNAGPPFTA